MKARNYIIWTLLGGLALSAAFAFSVRKSLEAVSAHIDGSSLGFGVGTKDDDANLAVVLIEGVISKSNETIEDLKDIDKDKGIKAVVVRIDSPGGSVGPSQEIYQAVMKLRKHKKVVCSMGDIAASGGYYIASACEKIVSNPGTLTGSIGVIMSFMNLKDLYKWAKVEPNIIKAGKFKDVGSESRAMTPEERDLMQKMINDVHMQFKNDVLAGRKGKLDAETVEMYADGRVLSGAQAKILGFVDELGGQEDAIRIAGEMAGIKGEPDVVTYDHKPNRWEVLMGNESQASNFDRIMGFLKQGMSASVLPLNPGIPYLLPYHFFSSGSVRAGGSR
jgi:protease-4